MPEYSIVTESDYGIELGSCRATGTRAAIADFVDGFADCVGSECEITRGDGVTVYNGELATDSQCAHSIDGKDVPSRVSPEPAPVTGSQFVMVEDTREPKSYIDADSLLGYIDAMRRNQHSEADSRGYINADSLLGYIDAMRRNQHSEAR